MLLLTASLLVASELQEASEPARKRRKKVRAANAPKFEKVEMKSTVSEKLLTRVNRSSIAVHIGKVTLVRADEGISNGGEAEVPYANDGEVIKRERFVVEGLGSDVALAAKDLNAGLAVEIEATRTVIASDPGGNFATTMTSPAITPRTRKMVFNAQDATSSTCTSTGRRPGSAPRKRNIGSPFLNSNGERYNYENKSQFWGYAFKFFI